MSVPWIKPSFSRRALGFTLIEIMVVVMIVGVLASGIAIVAGRDRLPALMSQQATVLKSHVRQLQVMALNESKPYGLVFSQEGWTIVEPLGLDQFLSSGVSTPLEQPLSWQKIQVKNKRGLDAQALPKQLRLVLERFDEPVDLDFTATANQLWPQIYIAPNGQVTPFSVEFVGLGSNRSGLEVDVSEIGVVTIDPGATDA